MNSYGFSLPSLGILVAVGCVGCASHTTMPPGTTLGEIKTSGMRVSSRERMVNERLERRRFLTAEIDKISALTASDFGLQGISTLRSVTGVAASLGLNLDAGGARQYRLAQARDTQRLQRQVEADAVESDIRKVMLKKVLDGLNDGSIPLDKAQTLFDAIKGKEPASPDKPGMAAPLLSQAEALRADAKALAESVAQVPQPNTAGISGSQVDLFRDKLALLEEIRSELIASELDERHDLYGGTLLRLSLDATVIPESDTSAWGSVRMTVKPVFDERLFSPAGFVEGLNDLATSRIVRAKRQYVTACGGRTLGFDQERTAINMLRRFAISERKFSSQRFVSFRASEKPTSQSMLTVKNADLDKLQRSLDTIRSEMTADVLAGRGDDALCKSSFEKALMPLVSRIFPSEIWGSTLSIALAKKSSDLELARAVEMEKVGEPWGAEEIFQFSVPNDERKQVLDIWLKAAETQIPTQIYAYAVTPKEQVQRIAQNGSRRDAMELALALQAVTGAGSASGAISMMKVNEAITSALHRQPLVVGYSELPEQSNAPSRTFGWVIGPRIKITEDMRGRPELGFRHRVVQNTLNAEMVVPSLAKALQVTVCTGWKADVGTLPSGSAEESCRTEEVLLPQSEEALAETFDPDARRPLPELYARRLVPLTTAKGGTALLLQGTNLWRNPQVFVGGLKASEVSVTSDMRGLAAVFDAPLNELDCKADRIVTVVTSTGAVDFGQMEPLGKTCSATLPANKTKVATKSSARK